MQKIKIFAVIVTVILAVLLAAALTANHNAEKEELQNAEKLEKMITPLNIKLGELDSERQALDDLYEKKINGMGTVGLVYINADDAVYDIAYQQMSEYGYSGVIALSDISFPGDEGCITAEQFDEMLAAGWKWCVTFPAESETPEADIDMLLARALDTGLENSNMIYFPDESYTPEYDEWLSAHGFDIVLHQEGNVDSESEEAWYADVVDWRSKLRRQYLAAASDNYASIVYEVTLRPDYIDTDTRFHSSLLSTMNEYCEDEKIRFLTPDEAKKYRLEVEAGQDAASKELQSKRDEIDAKIEAVHAEIDEICRKFEANKNT